MIPSHNPMQQKNFVTVLSTPCLLTTRESLAAAISTACHDSNRQQPVSVDFTNVHIVTLRTQDSNFYEHTSGVDWFVSDSQILSWSISCLGGRGHARVYGPDFLAHFFESGEKGLRHAFLGGSEECLDLLCAKVRELQPGVCIAATHHGYFEPKDEAAIINSINESKPDILWVGLGTPKQQNWIHNHKSSLDVAAILAVGFAFDVNAGTKRDAPAWLGPLGLTWLHRLISEPRRLWKRYLVYNTLYLLKFLRQVITGRTLPPPTHPI
jgi:N-acetylglucosaminyldiphosphoundecaprenol N-acetyl-beta-D-mannosaminyltransferase